ncbi:MAG: tRNA uridine-5-carboxymethylaminomethyl(34) synthesis GTPase MnmE [Flavobacteriales bacterium]|nr:tRNA uridine-5-carboxymethylaminomethyl(34) synthesis GTPase MnmE [Flavobacteriales bacterium]MCB0757679.1 tRNA uridine-5-carboxymethylaminomethyl(34) synthesis GTPase MnmE [Flavobacteriales bacterium]
MYAPDTIAALSTAPGTGAIAVLRISGPATQQVMHAVVPSMLLTPEPREAVFVRLRDAEGAIDEGLLTFFPGPHSYTGEDVAEISVHGSPYIQQRMLEALVAAGARLALPGEFTQRAFLNRKLDLSQAEAVADLIASGSRAAHTLALQQMRGGYSQRIEGLRDQLISLGALVELELDFGEEDVQFADRAELMKLLDGIVTVCDELIGSFRYGNAVKQGVPVAIVGAPNSGKSTLLNALLQEDRAIVSDIPGTTRDTVEETISLDGVLFRFIDTAGIRQTKDSVEKLGIERSYRKAAEASIVVLLGDAGTLSEGAFSTQAEMLRKRVGKGPLIIPVLNKSDLVPKSAKKSASTVMHISAKNGDGLEALKARFTEHVRSLNAGESDIVVTNARHVEALTKARTALLSAKKGVQDGISGELLATDLRQAQYHLGAITGQITVDDLLGSIFSRFCIGK